MLKVVIDKEGGVTLGACETFSRRLEALLDVEDPIQGPYNLEVSSPGLDRPLRSLGDFEKHVGKLIRVTTRENNHYSRRTREYPGSDYRGAYLRDRGERCRVFPGGCLEGRDLVYYPDYRPGYQTYRSLW